MVIYDVAIIGAGPAGAMLARLLRGKGLKIAIFDVRILDKPFVAGELVKSCGGLIAPDASEFLIKYGIKLPKNVISKIQSKWVKTTDISHSIIRTYKRNYVNVKRQEFDRFLLEDIEADKYFGYRIRAIESDDGFVINNEFKAKIVVGADGANSIVRKTFFPDFKTREYVSVQEVFEGNVLEDFECFFDKESTDYYGWKFSKEKECVLGIAVPKGKNIQEIFEKFKHKLGYKKGLYKEGALIIRPKLLHPVLCKKNVFLIGEAGGYLSPSSAEGFSFAFRTAEILAESGFDELKFRKKMLAVQASIFVKNIKSVFMYNPWLRFIIMCLSIRKNPAKDKHPKALDKLQRAEK